MCLAGESNFWLLPYTSCCQSFEGESERELHANVKNGMIRKTDHTELPVPLPIYQRVTISAGMLLYIPPAWVVTRRSVERFEACRTQFLFGSTASLANFNALVPYCAKEFALYKQAPQRIAADKCLVEESAKVLDGLQCTLIASAGFAAALADPA